MTIQESDVPSWKIAGVTGIQGPVRGSQYYSAAAVPWQPTSTAGFWIKPLFEDRERGEKTMLMKVDPGAFAESHVHDYELEQLYVLEGTFTDQERTLKVGDYCCRAPDAVHSGGSHEGALLLVMYTQV